MDRVYDARNTRLHRTVALKVLAPGFSADPALRARPGREAPGHLVAHRARHGGRATQRRA